MKPRQSEESIGAEEGCVQREELVIGLVIAPAIVCALANAPVPRHEECPYVSAEGARDQSTLAFEGRVVELKLVENGEQKATLEVKQVWKGRPRKETEVFFVVNSSTSPAIEFGKTYLFFTRPRTVEERQEARLPPHSPHREAWVRNCSGVMQPSPKAYEALGPSRPPD